MRAVGIDSFGTLVSLYCFVFTVWLIPSTSSNTPVIINSEGLTCWTPEKLAWNLTCTVTVLDNAYVSSIQVKALDRFALHSIIAKCDDGAYLFSSFAQFMGPSGSQCPLPTEQPQKETYRVPFSFTNVAANSDGRLSFPVRNISCGAIVKYVNSYKLYSEEQTQDLIQCVRPAVELPSIYNVTDGKVLVVTCSAWNAIPEANISLTITSAANRSLFLHSATGVNNAMIVINASSMYHKAAVTCTVLNHAHYLAPKTSEILVCYLSRKTSEIESVPRVANYDDVLNCSQEVDSYPDAEFSWYMNGSLSGNESSFSVPCSDGVILVCVATNPTANASVYVPYSVKCNLQTDVEWVFGVVTAVVAVVVVVAFVVVLRCCHNFRAHHQYCHDFRVLRHGPSQREHNQEVRDEMQPETYDNHEASGGIDLLQQVPLKSGESWSKDNV